MKEWKNMIVTEIKPPVIVHSEKGRKFEMKNRESFGLSLCISGQICYKMNGKEFVSTENTAVILPQGATYTLLNEKDGFFPLINFKCMGFVCDEIVVIPLKNPQVCLKCFEEIKKQYHNEENLFQTFSLFYKLLNEISIKNMPTPNLISRATKYIKQNLSHEGLTNVLIAQQLGISEVYLRKLFAHHLNTTPKQYILELRIQEAKRLLTDSIFTVSTISEKCGFSSVYYFSREFKKKTGVSPSLYAKKNRMFEL